MSQRARSPEDVNDFVKACIASGEYPDDWHPHEWYMKRVRLFAWIAAIGLVGAVAWMVVGML